MIHRGRSVVVIVGAGLALAAGAQAAPSFAPTTVLSNIPSLSHVYLLAVKPALLNATGSWRVNDAPGGKAQGIDLDAADVLLEDGGYYGIAAINADGGVSVMLPSGNTLAGVTEWTDLFDTDMTTVHDWLMSGDGASLEDWFRDEVYDAGLATRSGKRNPLVGFGAIVPDVIVRGGATNVNNVGSVPAPSMMALVGLSTLSLARRRR